MKILNKEVSHGKQSITQTILLSHKKNKLKISIKSDSYMDQCKANVYIYNKTDNKWNNLYSIPSSNMQTPSKMVSDDVYKNNDNKVVMAMQDDVDTLIKRAKQILD